LAAGDLDTSFDGDGMVTPPFSLQSVAIQTDGKIVVAGADSSGPQASFDLVRYNTDGSLDTSFSGDGTVTTGFGFAEAGTFTSVALQADGKIVAVGAHATILGASNICIARYNTDGSPDTSFSGDGELITQFGGTFAGANDVAIQADGKIVIVGVSVSGDNGSFGVARFNTDGSFDTSFSSDGRLTTDFGSGGEGASAMAIQADGKIVVAGNSNGDIALARYNANGSLDTSFSSDGKLTTAVGSSSDVASDVAIQADGKIVVAGASYDGSNNDFAIIRYNANGSLDTSFSGDGKLTTDIGSFDNTAYGVAIQVDGKIVAAGNGLARYNANGSLDTTFSGDGKLTGSFAANGLAIQADGKIVTAGDGLARYHGDLTSNVLVGDYNGDDSVGADDYVAWRKLIGAPNILNRDHANTGPVDDDDYDSWRENFGNAIPGSGAGVTAAAGQGSTVTSRTELEQQENEPRRREDQEDLVLVFGISDFEYAEVRTTNYGLGRGGQGPPAGSALAAEVEAPSNELLLALFGARRDDPSHSADDSFDGLRNGGAVENNKAYDDALDQAIELLESVI
jgi:uncharacterized delta-60 repeat protein